MDAVASWDGRKADALRRALRMTNEQFAEHLGISVRIVKYWGKRPDMIPLQKSQEILDAALSQSSDQIKAQFQLLLSGNAATPEPYDAAPSAENAGQISAWLGETSLSDDAVDTLAAASISLARAHIEVPPGKVLEEVWRLHQQAQLLLQSGKQRFRQTRELMRINSDLMAHACVLLGDLGANSVAAKYGEVALLFAHEAETDEALAWTALAKTARWQGRYIEAADMARRGFDVGRRMATRVELAYREALAAALAGDVTRSREALDRGETAADAAYGHENGVSVWSFPLERQAVFGLSVALHTGDPDAALQAAAMADAGWTAGDPRNPANWAQVRTGAAMAHLLKDSLDGAAAEVIPVLDLHPNLRINTVTGYLRELDGRLMHPRFALSKTAIELRQHIREFNSTGPAYQVS